MIWAREPLSPEPDARYVTSDTDAISSRNNHHNYSHTPLEAVTYGLRDGRCDVESSVGGDNWYATYIPQFVRNGTLEESYVDTAIKDTFRVRLEAGLFDPMEGQRFPSLTTPDSAANDAESARRDAIVLLQNREEMLPLAPSKHSVALIGPFAQAYKQAVLVTNPGMAVTVAAGCAVASSSTSGFGEAVAAAKSADVVILCLGSDASQEHEYHDRTNTTLPGVQAQLAEQLLGDSSVVSKAVVVLSMRGALAVDSIKSRARAILVAWEYGHDGGSGPIADASIEAVFGAISPGGRLPVTMYGAGYIEQANFFEMSMTAGRGRSYKYYQDAPLWPFGWGLSYCNFSLHTEVTNGPALPLELTATVATRECHRYVGSGSADEVLQLYFVPPQEEEAPSPTAGTADPLPRRQLIDFARLAVPVGGSGGGGGGGGGGSSRLVVAAAEPLPTTTVHHFAVSIAQLATVRRDGSRSTLPGRYQLLLTNGVGNTDKVEVHV
jgi:hypothetical protein